MLVRVHLLLYIRHSIDKPLPIDKHVRSTILHQSLHRQNPFPSIIVSSTFCTSRAHVQLYISHSASTKSFPIDKHVHLQFYINHSIDKTLFPSTIVSSTFCTSERAHVQIYKSLHQQNPFPSTIVSSTFCTSRAHVQIYISHSCHQ